MQLLMHKHRDGAENFAVMATADFFNFHNTIHILLPHNDSAATDRATILNGRITAIPCNAPMSTKYVNDSTENASTLDQWYGDTSPMRNTQPGETINCRTFNQYTQRFGGPIALAAKRLVTDPSRTGYEATQKIVAQVVRETQVRRCCSRLPPASVCFIRTWD